MKYLNVVPKYYEIFKFMIEIFIVNIFRLVPEIN